MTAIRRDGASGRFYQVGDRLLPSVTHILSAGVNKPALIPWAANQERALVSTAAADLYAEHAGKPVMSRTVYLARLQARLGHERAHQKLLTKGGDIGSETHKLIEWTLRLAVGADAGPKPVVSNAALWGFMAFEDWAKSVQLKPILIERTIYSLTHGYAGTMDLLARVEGVPTLIELKTSKGIYPESFLQAAAYSVALEEMGYLEPTQSLVVRLPKVETDPAFQVAAVPPRADLFPVFLAAKQLWQWQYENDAAYRARRVA